MVIGLFGFSFEDRNKGCEALTYSFISLLEKIVEDDLTVINLSGIGQVDKIAERFPDIKFDAVGFQRNNISIKSFRRLMQCDYVFDCTFGDNFSDIYSLPFVSRTTNYKEMTLLLGKKLIIAPQTIGPFKDEKLKKRVGKVLKKSALVFTRDEMSSQCVRELSGREPITVTDLAFILPYQKREADGKLRAGINVSGLLWRGGFDQKNQFGLTLDYHNYVDSVVSQLKQRGYEIHFISHVLSHDENEIDEDYKVSIELSGRYGEEHAPFFQDPIEAKNYISGMDVFIGSRMHSTIAAFSSGVITIPVSYSRKFEGLFNSIGYDYTINARKLVTDEAIKKTIYYIDNRNELKRAQEIGMQRIGALNQVLETSIRDFFRAFTVGENCSRAKKR